MRLCIHDCCIHLFYGYRFRIDSIVWPIDTIAQEVSMRAVRTVRILYYNIQSLWNFVVFKHFTLNNVFLLLLCNKSPLCVGFLVKKAFFAQLLHSHCFPFSIHVWATFWLDPHSLFFLPPGTQNWWLQLIKFSYSFSVWHFATSPVSSEQNKQMKIVSMSM